MAIDLPPPVTPVLEEVAFVQASGQLQYTGSWQGAPLRVHSSRSLPERDLDEAIARAGSLSDAVRAIARVYYASGMLTARTWYARVGDTVHVGVTEGDYAGASVSAPLDPYFSEMVEDDGGLDVAALERGRALASIHADRANLMTQASFEPVDRDVQFSLSATESADSPTDFHFEIGNPGNRFVGRHFASIQMRTGTLKGDEIKVFWRNGLMGLNEDTRADDYVEHQISWGRVTNWGLFSASGRYINFDLLTSPNLTGELWYGELSWLDILHADLDSRWTAHVRMDRNTKLTEVQETKERLQWEPYWSAELGTSYQQVMGRLFNGAWSVDAALVARKGLGNAAGSPVTQASLTYLLARPSVRLNWQSRGGDWGAGFAFDHQWTDDRVPEQQQWVLGGLQSVRAWLPGVAVGDMGSYASIDLSYLGLRVMDSTLRLRAFAEVAETNFNAVAGNPASDKARLADAGLELAWQPSPLFEMTLTAASPLTEDNVDQAVLDEAEADWFVRIVSRF